MTRSLPTLARRRHPLASSETQRAQLARVPLRQTFDQAVASAGHAPLRARALEILQINVGKRCNQTCRHCHVDAGPDRDEVMSDAVLDACLALVEGRIASTVDITGGAPELHPRFCEIVVRATKAGVEVIDRCNLTILETGRGRSLPAFFADHRVEVVASLPWYAPGQTDAQRGDGVFEASLAALRALNAVGYGREGTGLAIHLVTNPVGSYLFDDPAALEIHYKAELERRHGVVFNRLYTLTNMPVSRFLEYLLERDQLEEYLETLVRRFNPATVDGLMCRNTLSVGHDGRLYDCDFNQMLELALPATIFDVDAEALAARRIMTAAHCFGCTAGCGSSCGGALV
jgi:radical SAM/Cys-rich protein